MAANERSPESEASSNSPRVRLQRFLAGCGFGSRRSCEELITSGRVTVNGTVAALGATIDPQQDDVAVDGQRVRMERKKYYMLNKPPGYLCTAYDPAHRPLVLDLFPEDGPRLFTVGRLDENTTGLLIVTNDGDLAQKLAHPRYRIYRQYKALVAGHPTREIFDQLKEGFYFTEGKFRVYDLRPLKKQGDSTWVEVTMTEGQNREVRRLFARVGHKVMKLQRIGFGPLHLGRLPLGEYRELTSGELAQLYDVLDRNITGKQSPRKQKPAKYRRSETKKQPPAKKTHTGKQTLVKRSRRKKSGPDK